MCRDSGAGFDAACGRSSSRCKPAPCHEEARHRVELQSRSLTESASSPCRDTNSLFGKARILSQMNPNPRFRRIPVPVQNELCVQFRANPDARSQQMRHPVPVKFRISFPLNPVLRSERILHSDSDASCVSFLINPDSGSGKISVPVSGEFRIPFRTNFAFRFQ